MDIKVKLNNLQDAEGNTVEVDILPKGMHSFMEIHEKGKDGGVDIRKVFGQVKYPIIHHPHIYQYDDNVFVWFDEAGLIGGAKHTLEEAERALALYGQSLMNELYDELIQNDA